MNIEILANIHNTEDYTIGEFHRKHFGRCVIPPLHHKTVGEMLSGRKIVAALELITSTTWQGRDGLAGNQTSSVTLENGDVTRILLLRSAKGDKLSLGLMGDATSVDVISIAYVGEEDQFHRYLKDLNIEQLTIYGNLYHLETEE